MKSFGIAACAIVMFSGCTTNEMKFTPFYEGDNPPAAGAATDRVNLWPLAYWREPSGAVAWPLVVFSDDHFAFRPVYSQYKQSGKDGDWDEFNFAWPLAQIDTKNSDCRVFPVFWGEDKEKRGYQAVFPLYWNGKDYNALLPLWIKGKDAFVSPLYAQGCENGKSWWAIPVALLVKKEDSFVSPIYAQGSDGSNSWWMVPVALSKGKERFEGSVRYRENRFLLNVGGSSEKYEKGVDEGRWWVFPFMERKWNFSSGGFGLEVRMNTTIAASLAGWTSSKDRVEKLWAFPLLYWNRDGSWLTALGGRLNGAGVTNTVITPLMGVMSGRRTGGWLFPIWESHKDMDFDKTLAFVDSPVLPECIEISEHTNRVAKGAAGAGTYLHGEYFTKTDNAFVLLHDFDHFIRGESRNHTGTDTNKYVFTEGRKRGNGLLLNCSSKREVAFDMKTREKVSDSEEGEITFSLLYSFKWTCDRMDGGERARHRVLWKLWDWSSSNGDVSLDVFPGFTYDSRKDGYSKTSFLWRIFRYERTKCGRKNMDIFFIPVLR